MKYTHIPPTKAIHMGKYNVLPHCFNNFYTHYFFHFIAEYTMKNIMIPIKIMFISHSI